MSSALDTRESRVIHSARIVDDGQVTEDGWVRIEDGRVTARGTGEDWSPADVVIDATAIAGPGALLTPGFIDIHGHGGAGAAFDDGVDAIRAARAMHTTHGTTRAVVSFVTAPLDDLSARVAMVADLRESDADILGSHLEGPFLDPAITARTNRVCCARPRQPMLRVSSRPGAAPSVRSPSLQSYQGVWMRSGLLSWRGSRRRLDTRMRMPPSRQRLSMPGHRSSLTPSTQ